jgi:hypothetical protein
MCLVGNLVGVAPFQAALMHYGARQGVDGIHQYTVHF